MGLIVLVQNVRGHLITAVNVSKIRAAKSKISHLETCSGGPGSSVGIATAYGLDGPGIESRWGEIFRTSPDRP